MELGIEERQVIHQVTLSGRGAFEQVSPSVIEARVGDIVQFVSGDRRIHTISFYPTSRAQEEFLDASGQRSSPPLIDIGSRFVVSFEAAPPGEYPFGSAGHGDSAAGRIILSPR